MTETQINALKYLIFKSKDITVDEMRQLMFYMIDQSENLTKRIYCEVKQPTFLKTTVEATWDSVRGTRTGTTHLPQVMKLMNTEFRFCVASGGYVDGKFNPELEGYTVWLSDIDYDHIQTTEVNISPEIIANVELKNYLYNH